MSFDRCDSTVFDPDVLGRSTLGDELQHLPLAHRESIDTVSR